MSQTKKLLMACMSQDLVSSQTFQNRVRLANLSATDESGQNRAEIVCSLNQPSVVGNGVTM